jgi:hypothetical protein
MNDFFSPRGVFKRCWQGRARWRDGGRKADECKVVHGQRSYERYQDTIFSKFSIFLFVVLSETHFPSFFSRTCGRLRDSSPLSSQGGVPLRQATIGTSKEQLELQTSSTLEKHVRVVR